jgi:hypothetical protein
VILNLLGAKAHLNASPAGVHDRCSPRTPLLARDGHFSERPMIGIRYMVQRGTTHSSTTTAAVVLTVFLQLQRKTCHRPTSMPVVVPGHGQLGSRKDLVELHELLLNVRDGVNALKKSGHSLEEFIAAKPTAKFDAE